MVAADLTNTYLRSLIIEFTTPFSYDPMVLVIPYPELDSTINRIVKPFQYQVQIVYLNYVAEIMFYFFSI